jgi:hypothetical protein
MEVNIGKLPESNYPKKKRAFLNIRREVVSFPPQDFVTMQVCLMGLYRGDVVEHGKTAQVREVIVISKI